MEAVYEGGVLRPMQPIPLADGTRVEVIVIAPEQATQNARPASILAWIAALPVGSGGEPFSGRDHDRVLYGEESAQ
ncbi:MAG: antitoxin family protein [Chloroflexota bacterium]